MSTNIKLDEIVNMYLDAWELPDSQYGRIFTLGVRGFRQIYAHAQAAPISVELEVLANKTSILPCDCLNKIDLGVLNALGEISPLTEDSNLGLGMATSDDRLGQPTDTRLTLDNESDIYYNADGNYLTPFVFGQFGSGARSDLGFFRMDYDARLIVYDFAFSYPSVWLEYLPMFTDNGEYNVNPFFVEAIIAFIEWNDKRRSPSDRNTARQTYYNEIRIGKRSMKPFDVGQVYNSYNRSTRQARY